MVWLEAPRRLSTSTTCKKQKQIQERNKLNRLFLLIWSDTAHQMKQKEKQATKKHQKNKSTEQKDNNAKFYLFATPAGAESLSVEVVVQGQFANGIEPIHRHRSLLLLVCEVKWRKAKKWQIKISQNDKNARNCLFFPLKRHR